MLNEKTIIQSLQPFSQGFIGDDAAVLPPLNQEQYVITKDLLVEDIHFRKCYFTPQELARKALQVNLSDLAAMGAKPLYILCGITIPMDCGEYGQAVLQQLIHACQDAGVTLIGGDTTRSPDKLYISITAIGVAHKEHIRYRHTAQQGDIICVIGNLGWAQLGLLALEQNIPIAEQYKVALLKPNAKVKEGLWLATQPDVTSQMDISDGVYIDLKRLCEASTVGANIDLDKLPKQKAFIEACQQLKEESRNIMLTGGEDYGLLFTVTSNAYEKLAYEFQQTFGYPIYNLGVITPGAAITLSENNKTVNLTLKAFTHFGEPS